MFAPSPPAPLPREGEGRGFLGACFPGVALRSQSELANPRLPSLTPPGSLRELVGGTGESVNPG